MPDDKIIDIKTAKPKVGGRKRPPGPGGGHKVKMGNGSTGLPAMGAGWGGEAKGARDPAFAGAAMKACDTPERRRTNEEMRIRAMKKLDELIDSEHAGIALQASNSMLDRIEGKAVQRLASTPGGETVEELRTIDAANLTVEQRKALRAVVEAEKGRR